MQEFNNKEIKMYVKKLDKNNDIMSNIGVEMN